MASSTDDIITAIERGFANASKGKVSKGENVNVKISSAEIEQANNSVGKLREEINALQIEVENTTAGSQEYTDALDRLVKKQKEYTEEVDKTTKSLKKQEGALGRVWDAIVEVSATGNEVQKLSRDLQRMGNTSKEVARMSSRLGDSLRISGVTYEGTAAAAQTLVSGVSDFTMMSGQMQKSLMRDSALFAELGVSNDQYAKGLQLGIKSMGLTSDKAAQNMRTLRSTALAMQVPVGELTDDYIAQEGKLAELGATGFKSFQEMARIQKVTGLEMGKLIQMTDKFDTFEGAAESAGSLNAALGGNFVDSMSLMMEDDPAERFKMIRDAIEDAGVSVEDMGRKQQMFMANAANFDNVADFKKALSGDLSALTKEAEGAGVDPAMKDLETAARNIRSQTEIAANMALAVAPAYGTLAAKAEEFVDKHAPALTEAAAKLNKMNIDATEKLSSAAAAALMSAEGAQGWWEKFSEIKDIIVDIGLAVLAFGGRMKKMAGGIKDFFTGASKGAAKTTKLTWKLNEAGKVVVRNNGKFASAKNLSGLQKLHVSLAKMAQTMKGGLAKGLSKVGGLFTSMRGGLGNFLKLGSKLGPMLGRGLKMMTKFGKTNPITIALAGIVEGFIKVKAAGGDLADYLGGGLIGAFGAFAELGDFIFGGFIGSIGRLFGVDLGDTGLLTLIGKGINKMIGGVEMGFQEAWEALDWGFIGETFEYMWNGVVDWVYDFLGIASPSQVFMDIGTSIMDGITSMLDADSLMSAAQMMVDALLFPFTSLGSLLMDLVGAAFDLVPDSVKSFMGFEVETASDTAAALAGATTGGVTAKAGAGAGNNNADPYVINLAMNLDGKEIDKKVINIVGGIAKQATL